MTYLYKNGCLLTVVSCIYHKCHVVSWLEQEELVFLSEDASLLVEAVILEQLEVVLVGRAFMCNEDIVIIQHPESVLNFVVTLACIFD